MTQRPIKLTAAQARVMHWMSQGWSARNSHGAVIEINGEKVCNVDTLAALQRHGLIEKDTRFSNIWNATPEGRKLSPNYREPEAESR